MKTTLWHYQQDGRPQGPVSEEEMLTLLAAGKLSPSDLVWHKGLSEWVEIRHSALSEPNAGHHAPPPLPGEVEDHKTPPPIPATGSPKNFWLAGCLVLVIIALLGVATLTFLAFRAYRNIKEEIPRIEKSLPKPSPVPPEVHANSLRLPDQFPAEISGAEKQSISTEKPQPGMVSHHTATYLLTSGNRAVLHLIELQSSTGQNFFSTFLSALKERKDVRVITEDLPTEEASRKTILLSTIDQGLYLIQENKVLIMVSAPTPGDAEEIGQRLRVE